MHSPRFWITGLISAVYISTGAAMSDSCRANGICSPHFDGAPCSYAQAVRANPTAPVWVMVDPDAHPSACAPFLTLGAEPKTVGYGYFDGTSVTCPSTSVTYVCCKTADHANCPLVKHEALALGPLEIEV